MLIFRSYFILLLSIELRISRNIVVHEFEYEYLKFLAQMSRRINHAVLFCVHFTLDTGKRQINRCNSAIKLRRSPKIRNNLFNQ